MLTLCDLRQSEQRAFGTGAHRCHMDHLVREILQCCPQRRLLKCILKHIVEDCIEISERREAFVNVDSVSILWRLGTRFLLATSGCLCLGL